MPTQYYSVNPRQTVSKIIVTELQYKEIRAGEGLSTWDVVFQDGSFVKPANASGPSTMDAIGILTNNVGSGVAIDVVIRGRVENAAWTLTSGTPVFVATSAGLTTQTPPTGSGQIVQEIGAALTQTLIDFNPKKSVQVGQ